MNIRTIYIGRHGFDTTDFVIPQTSVLEDLGEEPRRGSYPISSETIILETENMSGGFLELPNNCSEACAEVFIGRGTFLGKFCEIGCPNEQRIKSCFDNGLSLEEHLAPVRISDRCIIGNHVTIYEGVEIGGGTTVDDFVRIGYNSKIGNNVRIMYGAYICDRVNISNNARIAGFVCDGAEIGERSTMMGNLVHEYTSPHLSWWDADEEPPIIESDVIVGWGAYIVGAIRVSSRTYVASGAIVTKDVPPGHVVTGVNRQIPLKHWKGKRLRNLVRCWSNGIP